MSDHPRPPDPIPAPTQPPTHKPLNPAQSVTRGVSTQRKPRGDDVLTARDLVEQHGLAPRVAESIVRSLLRQGKGVPSPIRRRLVRRKDVFPEGQSDGGKTWA